MNAVYVSSAGSRFVNFQAWLGWFGYKKGAEKTNIWAYWL
ncbi:hypothetical protein PLO_0926 [Pediococcus acidilactici NGRI 0510Q]|nr:hypothetical protein PLO_0926 [Pediococcus acidilactici NGRI 0510Q]